MADDLRRGGTDTGTVDAENPWPGLAAFREADQLFFQGRETVVDELTRMVLRSRLTVLHGVSGLGKTSVLRAGLFPRLRREHVLPIYVRLAHADESAEPVVQVRDAIERAARASGVEAPVWTDGLTLWEYFHRRDAQFWDARNRILTPLLVFDQFEELFTLGRGTAARRARTDTVIVELSDLVEGRPAPHVRTRLEQDPEEALRFSMSDQPCKVLLSLREDFLPDLAELRHRMPAITETMYRLQPMTTAEAMRVVEIGGGDLVDHDVAGQIVRFVASAKSDAGADGESDVIEPALLSVFCRELNNKRRAQGGGKITADLLEGSRTAIIADFYGRTISEGGLSPAIRVFVEERLLTESGFRDSIAEEQALRTPGIAPADIEILIARRLLRREDAGAKSRSRLELTHDVLAQAVRASRDRRRLREQQERAIVEQRAVEARQRQEAEEAAAREQQRREFETARALAAKQQEAAVLAQALAREEQRGREAAERLARTRQRQMVSLSILLVAIATLAGVALYAARSARQARNDANRELSATYVDRATHGEPWALPLLARAIRIDPDSTMARALLVGHLVGHVMERAALDHGEATVESAVFNSAGTRVLTMSTTANSTSTMSQGTVRLWDADTGRRVGATGLTDNATVSSFSTDGARVLTGSHDGMAQIWDSGTGTRLGELRHQSAVIGASFDPAGTRVLTVSNADGARLWDPDSGQVTVLPAAGAVVRAEFGPRGAVVLTMTEEGDAVIWDAGSGKPISPVGTASGEADRITQATFHPDGTRIVAVFLNGTARIFDTRTGRAVGSVLREPAPQANQEPERIGFARFDPTGARILTTSTAASADGQVAIARIWDAATGARLPVQMSHGGWISTAGFSPDGALVLTVSGDNTAQIWDASTGEPRDRALEHGRPVVAAAFSPDGRRVLTASEDGTAQLWDARTGAVSGSALRHAGPVAAAAFSADGTRVVTASLGRARIWDARTGVTIETRLRHPAGVRITMAALSHDAAYVATVGTLDPELTEAEREQRFEEEQIVRVWDASTGQPANEPLRHEGAISSIRFSPTGPPRIVTASADGTARIWDARSAAPVGTVLTHRGPVFSAAFSADGARVITASADGSASIWDAGSGNLVSTLDHCEAGTCTEVRSAGFNLAGSQVVTLGADGRARVWETDGGLAVGTLSQSCDGEPNDHGGAAPSVEAVSFSPDGAFIMTSDYSRSQIWRISDASEFESLRPCLPHDGARNLPVFGQSHPRKRLQVATTSTIDVARVWDVGPDVVLRWELPRDAAVVSASFSDDGRLVTASHDGTTRIWNLRAGQETGLAQQHTDGLGWTTFSTDGARILTLAADGIARIWDVPAGRSEDADALAALADAMAGRTIDDDGRVRHLENGTGMSELRERTAAGQPTGSFADALVHWLFADPATRTISPVSRVTVPEYLARLRQEGESGVDEAMRLFPGLPAAMIRGEPSSRAAGAAIGTEAQGRREGES